MCSQVSESLSLKNQVCIFEGGGTQLSLERYISVDTEIFTKIYTIFKVLPENRTSRIYLYMYLHTCVHIYMYICMCVHICIYVCTHTHTRGTERDLLKNLSQRIGFCSCGSL